MNAKRSVTCGPQIAEARRAAGLNQYQFGLMLSEQLGFDPSYAWKIENDERTPSLATFCQIARMLDRPLDSLVAITDDQDVGTPSI